MYLGTKDIYKVKILFKKVDHAVNIYIVVPSTFIDVSTVSMKRDTTLFVLLFCSIHFMVNGRAAALHVSSKKKTKQFKFIVFLFHLIFLKTLPTCSTCP